MAISDISLTAGMRSNLLSMQGTNSLINRTQDHLSTGKKVNTVLDNPTNFFAAQSHMARASDLATRKDDMGEFVQVVKTADTGIKAITSIIEAAKGVASATLAIPRGEKCTSVIDHEVELFCNVLSVDPIIIVGYGSPGPFEPAWTLCEALKYKRVHFLMGSWWSLQVPAELVQTMFRYKEMNHKYPNHSFTYMVNDPIDLEILQKVGIPAVFCHQNSFVDERIYRVIPGTEKRYDAIYNARLESFKRHILTSKLGSTAHIYYNCSGQKGLAYLHKIRPFLGNGVFLNDDPETGAYRFLNHSEICRHYNESCVGLCLSPLEGAMYVSVEYLLSGLPVITTKNIGGRNFFLDPEYCMEVAPDPYVIRDAAEELTARGISPEYIRRKTLIRMLKQRQIFIDIVQSIYDQEGVNRRFADEWEKVYVNKMHVFGIPNWQVLTYLREHEGHKGAITTPMQRTYNVSPPGDFDWG